MYAALYVRRVHLTFICVVILQIGDARQKSCERYDSFSLHGEQTTARDEREAVRIVAEKNGTLTHHQRTPL
jgi:hypothetical protein